MNAKDEMVISLKETNLYFKSIIDLIPPKAYFDADSNQKIAVHQLQSTVQKAGKHKQGDGDGRKHKKVKFDPSQPRKTSELQQILPTLDYLEASDEDHDVEMQEGEQGKQNVSNGSSSASRKDKKYKHTTASENATGSVKAKKRGDGTLTNKLMTATQPSASVALQSNGKVEHLLNDKDMKKPESSEVTSSENSSGPSPVTVLPRLNPDQLREKLRSRISELQAKRQQGMTAEEFMESKKLRRKESKLKLKQKRKEAKKLKLSVEKQAKNSHSKMNGVSEVQTDPEKNTSNNTKMVFSKFEFSEQAKKPKDRKQKKPKSYKDLYEKVTKDKQKLEQLKETDAEKAKQISEKNAWRKAMDQSKGIKVKDNPELIKKSMKKEESMKRKSQKKWQERKDSVTEQQQKRQDKRNKNIAAKKQTKVDRKIKTAKKKGRIVSGF